MSSNPIDFLSLPPVNELNRRIGQVFLESVVQVPSQNGLSLVCVHGDTRTEITKSPEFIHVVEHDEFPYGQSECLGNPITLLIEFCIDEVCQILVQVFSKGKASLIQLISSEHVDEIGDVLLLVGGQLVESEPRRLVHIDVVRFWGQLTEDC